MSFNGVLANSNPFDAYASAAIDAGAFVISGSSDDVVTSAGMSSLSASDIIVTQADANTDYKITVGIAGNIASAAADKVAVYTEGLFVVRTSAAITVGNRVQKAESTDAFEVSALTSTAGHKIGTALTGASAGDKYIILLLSIGT